MLKRPYNRKSTVKRGRKPSQWTAITIDPTIPVQRSGERHGFVWFNEVQKPFDEWQILQNGTINVMINVVVGKHNYGRQFINVNSEDIALMAI